MVLQLLGFERHCIWGCFSWASWEHEPDTVWKNVFYKVLLSFPFMHFCDCYYELYIVLKIQDFQMRLLFVFNFQTDRLLVSIKINSK